MYTSVNDFLNEWKQEAAITQKVLDALTDESLNQEVHQDYIALEAWLGILREQLTTSLHRSDYSLRFLIFKKRHRNQLLKSARPTIRSVSG
jgi:hypothetical protein